LTVSRVLSRAIIHLG